MQKSISIFLSIVLIMMLLLTGCSCNHDWENPDCENPRTCSKCGETKGEAKGHSWKDATCIDPKTCKRCGQTKGSPLGHTPGEYTEYTDVIECCRHTTLYCSVCSLQLESEITPITTFSVDNRFLFSAEDFMKRMEHISKDYYSDFSYRFTTGQLGELQILVDLDGKAPEEFYITCFFDTNIPVLSSESSIPGIWCISLGSFGTTGQLGTLIDDNVLSLFCMTCDPLLNEDNLNLIALIKLASLANYLDYGEPTGYIETNGMLYEFMHMEITDYAYELVQIYATNWQKDD